MIISIDDGNRLESPAVNFGDNARCLGIYEVAGAKRRQPGGDEQKAEDKGNSRDAHLVGQSRTSYSSNSVAALRLS